MSSDSARSPEDVGTGAPCPLEIFNEFQMDIQDPGSGSTPFLQACSQLKPGLEEGRCCTGARGPEPGTLGTGGGKSNGANTSASK